MGLVMDKEMATVSIVKATYSDPEIEALLAPLRGLRTHLSERRRQSQWPDGGGDLLKVHQVFLLS
jgi:hypothetical protein